MLWNEAIAFILVTSLIWVLPIAYLLYVVPKLASCWVQRLAAGYVLPVHM